MENSSDTDEECDTDEDFNYENRFSDDGIGEDQNVELGILEELAYWAVCHKIPHTALSSLLELLRKYHQNLPKDPHTLLKTYTKFKSAIRHIQGGSYYHCGVLKGMEQIFRKYPSLVDECRKESRRFHLNLHVFMCKIFCNNIISKKWMKIKYYYYYYYY